MWHILQAYHVEYSKLIFWALFEFESDYLDKVGSKAHFIVLSIFFLFVCACCIIMFIIVEKPITLLLSAKKREIENKSICSALCFYLSVNKTVKGLALLHPTKINYVVRESGKN